MERAGLQAVRTTFQTGITQVSGEPSGSNRPPTSETPACPFGNNHRSCYNLVISIPIKQCRDDYKYEELENRGTSELMSSILVSMRRMISNSELDLEAFSKETGIDREKIESEIQAETGGDFTSLLTFERIRSVKELLRDADIPFDEIAAKTGFTDLDNMRITFNQITCTTPEKYRERIKEEENSEEE